ncbi:MAG: O-antigen ligase family protein [Bacteroidota bacterium]
MPTLTFKNRTNQWQIDLNLLIFNLLCIYAFFVPLEMILEELLQIRTILKPYRVTAIAIFGLFVFKNIQSGIQIRQDVRQDSLLYALFGYGLIISAFRMITETFSTGLFYNDLFQLIIYLSVFFVVKNLPLTVQQIKTIFWSLLAGVMVNVVTILNGFLLLRNFERQSGFMDNPNYLGFALLAVSLFLLVYFRQRTLFKQISVIILLIAVLISFVVAGSRTCLIVLVMGLIYLAGIQNLRRKIIIFAVSAFAIGIAVLRFGGYERIAPLIVFNRLDRGVSEENIRITLWKGVIEASNETYFVGLGIGQFKARFAEFFRESAHQDIYEMVTFGYYLTAHSDYFTVLIVYGIVGLVCYIGYLFIAARKRFYQLQLHASTKLRQFQHLQVLLLLSVIVFGFTHESFTSGIYWLTLTFATKSVEK